MKFWQPLAIIVTREPHHSLTDELTDRVTDGIVVAPAPGAPGNVAAQGRAVT